MANEVLTTSNINSFVESYINTETSKSITPLKTRKTKYSNLSSTYSTLTTKLNSLKGLLENFKLTDSNSVFRTKSVVSSNENYITATASGTAAVSAYDLRVSQLAKNDLAISAEYDATAANAITGKHSFAIKTGDGSTGEFVSNIDVTFTGSETNKTVMEKIRDAITSDKASVTSNSKAAVSEYSGGASTFKINLNGTEKTISVNGGGTYSQLMDEMVANINSTVTGVTAEKIVDPENASNFKLQLTVSNNDHYITISHDTGNNIVSDLGIAVTKEKSAAGLVSASAFAPESGKYQFSMTSKNSGLDNRIMSIADSSGSSALASIGFNLGSARPQFNQSTSPDTPGFMYSDITSENNQLNARMVFNGLNLQRNSNKVDDIASGVVFTLKSVMKADDPSVNIAVNNSTADVKKQIETFITKFNDVYSYINNNYKTTDGKRGVLSSDANAQTLMSYLGTSAFSSIQGLPAGSLTQLNQIGISFTSGSGLSISNSTLLESKISSDATQVEQLFNSPNGLANTMYNKINPYLGVEGYLNKTRVSVDNNVKFLNDKITSTQTRIDKGAEILRRRYETLQAQLASLLTTQSMFM